MLSFFGNAYKELYAWFLYNTDRDLLSFGLSYVVLVLMEVLNVVCLILFTQKLLSISLVQFLLTQKLAIAFFLLIVIAGNYLLFGAIWRRGEMAKEHNNRAFAYIALSLLMGVAGYFCRP